MADVTIKYNGEAVAEMNGTGSKTLKTSGKYCEGDIEVNYTPNSRTYYVTIGTHNPAIWNLLVTLDADVLAHINDPTFTVMFQIIDTTYVYEKYSGTMYTASNVQIGTQNAALNPLYGYSGRQQSETSVSIGYIYHPANQTTSSLIGGYGAFRVSGGKYYLKPADGYIHKGNYRLTFIW